MSIPELKKPADVWCEHAGDHPGGGCGIYEERPQSCRDFKCSWLQDDGAFFRDSDRPDKLGTVFWVKAGGATDQQGDLRNVVVAMERHRGAALQRDRAREIIMTLRAKGIPVTIGCGSVRRAVQITNEGHLILDDPMSVVDD